MEMVNVSDKVETNRYQAKVLLKRFNVNGHTITFHPCEQRVDIHSERFTIDCEIETTYDLLEATTVNFRYTFLLKGIE